MTSATTVTTDQALTISACLLQAVHATIDSWDAQTDIEGILGNEVDWLSDEIDFLASGYPLPGEELSRPWKEIVLETLAAHDIEIKEE